MKNLKKIDIGSVLYQKTGCKTMYDVLELIKISSEAGINDKTFSQYYGIKAICESFMKINDLYE